jgi:hypothetical protein
MNVTLFRIHTKQDPVLATVVAQFFRGFTIQHGLGYYNGFQRNTATVEIYGTESDRLEVERLARTIATLIEHDEVVLAEVGRDGVSVSLHGPADIIDLKEAA